MATFKICMKCGYSFLARKSRRTRYPRQCPKCKSTQLVTTIYLSEVIRIMIKNYEAGIVDQNGKPLRKCERAPRRNVTKAIAGLDGLRNDPTPITVHKTRTKIPKIIVEDWGRFRKGRGFSVSSNSSWIMGRYGGQQSKAKTGLIITKSLAYQIAKALEGGDELLSEE